MAATPTTTPSPEWQSRRREILSIAPMMEYTDRSFRQMARIISTHTRLYTEMVVSGTLWFNPAMIDSSLRFDPIQRPVALQIGGSDPLLLAHAAALGAQYGYDEINLNCGCPSERVASAGCFGAALMMEPELVRKGCEAMIEAVRLTGKADTCKVTVKCRLGADHMDSYEEFKAFADAVAAAGVEHLIVHSRKCWLAGLSTKDNRNVPPLRPEWVLRLATEEGAAGRLRISINGGIRTLAESAALLRIQPDLLHAHAQSASHSTSAIASDCAAVDEPSDAIPCTVEVEDDHGDGSPNPKRAAVTTQPTPAASAPTTSSSSSGDTGELPKKTSRRSRKRGASARTLSALAASTATKEYHGPVLWKPADCTKLDNPPAPASNSCHTSASAATTSSSSPSSVSDATTSSGTGWGIRPVVPADLPIPAAFRNGLLDSVMIGRGAYDLWRFADADRSMFGETNPCPSRAEAIKRYVDTYAVVEEEHAVLVCETVLDGLLRFKAVRSDLIKPIGLLLRGVAGSSKCRQALNESMQVHRIMLKKRITEVKAEMGEIRAAIAKHEEEAAATSSSSAAAAAAIVDVASASGSIASMRARLALLGPPAEASGHGSAKTKLPPHPASVEEAAALAKRQCPVEIPAVASELRAIMAAAQPLNEMVMEAIAGAPPGGLEAECPSDPDAPWWDYTEKPDGLFAAKSGWKESGAVHAAASVE